MNSYKSICARSIHGSQMQQNSVIEELLDKVKADLDWFWTEKNLKIAPHQTGGKNLVMGALRQLIRRD
ncbi:hypothetical protein [Collimonas arenae]|nr:hypothetical protein [Collimonas arenae]